MEQILEYIANYGLPVFVIASVIIGFVGILKLCKVFDKITNKTARKAVFYAVDMVLSFAGVAIYFAIFKIDFAGYIAFVCTQIGATTTLYALYENFGVRNLVKMFIEWVGAKLYGDANAKLAELLDKLNIPSDMANNIKATVKAEIDKQAAQNE